MNDPIGWGVFVMLAGIALAVNIRELTELAHALTPWWRAWLERPKKRIGF